MPEHQPPTRPDRNGAPAPPRPARPQPSPEPAPPPAEPAGLEELIGEAEAVRATLAEAHARLGRLLAALKQQRRHSRAVEAALAALRQLPVSPWQRTAKE
jgi:hypothetical protein